MFSLVAVLTETDFGRIKIQSITIDVRGGKLDAELYYPVGTSDRDSLPAVIVSHGGTSNNGATINIAQELARRGFVVVNLSAHGAGLSEYPMYDESGHGIEKSPGLETQGLLDMINYVRSLKFVDSERIGLVGQSAGGHLSSYTSLVDTGAYTLNDLMLNVLANDFGVSLTAEEIGQDAAELAEKYLSDGEMLVYNLKLEEITEWYNTRVKVVIPLGSASQSTMLGLRPQTVEVAGHEVTRFAQVNVCMVMGEWDHNYPRLIGKSAVYEDETWLDYMQTGDVFVPNTWLKMTESGVADQLGTLDEVGLADSEELRDAFDNRRTRMSLVAMNSTHSQELISKKAITHIVHYLTEAFEYNNGELGNPNAIPVNNMKFFYREFANGFAMIAMIGALVSLIALLIKGGYFSGVVVNHDEAVYAPCKNKWLEIAFWIGSVAAATLACYWVNTNKHLVFTTAPTAYFPYDIGIAWGITYLFWVAVFSLILVAVCAVVRKKTEGTTGLEKLGVTMGIVKILKSLLLSFVAIIAAYISVEIIEYCFSQDYRFWVAGFAEMNTYQWGMLLRCFIVFVPLYFVLSCAINYFDAGKSKHPIREIILVVVACYAGVLIIHIINECHLWVNRTEWASFGLTAPMLFSLPLCAYVLKKSYKITGNVWTGAFVSALLNAWMFVSAGATRHFYVGTTFAEKFFGL